MAMNLSSLGVGARRSLGYTELRPSTSSVFPKQPKLNTIIRLMPFFKREFFRNKAHTKMDFASFFYFCWAFLRTDWNREHTALHPLFAFCYASEFSLLLPPIE